MGLSSSYKRWRWRSTAARSPLKPLYARAPLSPSAKVSASSFLVVDCEMTGLDPKKNALLSIGWVKVENLAINYASRKHVLLHARQGVGESVKIHGLDDRKIAGAANPSRALSMLVRDMLDTVLVFHHAVLDLAFLQRTSIQHLACPLIFQYVDTMEIERKRLDRQGRTGSLQLNLCRERYSLPPAFAHNAMYDAVATAELLLSQIAHIGDARLSLQGLGLKDA